MSAVSQPQPAPSEKDKGAGAWLRAMAGQAVLGAVALAWALATGQGVSGLLLFYWLENVVLGVAFWLRLLLGPPPQGSMGGKAVLLVGFPIHYGIFMVGHAHVLTGLFGSIRHSGFGTALLSLGPYAIGAIIVVSLALPLWESLRGTAGNRSPLNVGHLYGRLIAIHVTLIVAGLAAAWTNMSMTIGAVVGLVFAKLLGEWGMYRRSRSADSGGTEC